jgi:hypothetical protein
MTNKDRFASDGKDFTVNDPGEVYKIEGKEVYRLVNGKWVIKKRCSSYEEAINLLRKLQGR